MSTRWPETCWATYKGEINIILKVTSSWSLYPHWNKFNWIMYVQKFRFCLADDELVSATKSGWPISFRGLFFCDTLMEHIHVHAFAAKCGDFICYSRRYTWGSHRWGLKLSFVPFWLSLAVNMCYICRNVYKPWKKWIWPSVRPQPSKWYFLTQFLTH